MADTRSHHFVRTFQYSAEKVFLALITPSQIRRWWSASQAIVIPRVGGVWVATWGEDVDHPEFISSAIIKEFVPGEKLVLGDYQYVSPDGGLPFEADFETMFKLAEVGEGIELTVDQVGFPGDSIADEYYVGCEQGWKNTLDALEKFLRIQYL